MVQENRTALRWCFLGNSTVGEPLRDWRSFFSSKFFWHTWQRAYVPLSLCLEGKCTPLLPGAFCQGGLALGGAGGPCTHQSPSHSIWEFPANSSSQGGGSCPAKTGPPFHSGGVCMCVPGREKGPLFTLWLLEPDSSSNSYLRHPAVQILLTLWYNWQKTKLHQAPFFFLTIFP